MAFFGPYHVKEYPAYGFAALSVYFDVDGRPLFSAPEIEEMGDGEVTYSVGQEAMTLWIEANPWSGDRPRPFACDFWPAPASLKEPRSSYPNLAGAAANVWSGDHPRPLSESGGPQRRSIGPVGTLVVALARDARLDDAEYWREMGGAVPRGQVQKYPGLNLLVLRIQDAESLPDLGEAVSCADLLRPSKWNLYEEAQADIEDLREDGVDVMSDEKRLASVPLDLTEESVLVDAFPDGLFFMPTSGRWSVDVKWPSHEPSATAWELVGPVQTENNCKMHLRVVATKNVRIEHKSFRRQRRREEVDRFDVNVVKLPVEKIAEVPPQGSPLHYDRWELLPSTVSYDDPFGQRKHEIDLGLRKIVFASPAILSAPLMLNPATHAIGTLLGVALGYAGYEYSKCEHNFVLRHGNDVFGHPRSEKEVEEAVLENRIFLYIDSFLAVGGAAVKIIPRVMSWMKALGGFSLMRAIVEAEAPAIRLAVRQLRAAVLSRMIDLAATNPKTFLRLSHPLVKQVKLTTPPMLLDMELTMTVFVESYMSFRHPVLQRKYLAYVERAGRKLKGLGKALSAEELQAYKLVEDPLTWSLRQKGKIRDIFIRELGQQWRAKVNAFKPYVPVSEKEYSLLMSMQKAVPYDEAKAFRKSVRNKKTVKALFKPVARPLRKNLDKSLAAAQKRWKKLAARFESDHVFEDRCVVSLAKRYGISPDVLQEYAKGMTLLVPRNLRVARRIPGYLGYSHVRKTSTMKVLIAHGLEGNYTLQEIRDAHYFAIMTLGGPDNPGLAILDDVVRQIASEINRVPKIKVTVDFRPPSPHQFSIGEWRYYVSKGKYALNKEQFRQQLELVQMDVAGESTRPDPWLLRIEMPKKLQP